MSSELNSKLPTSHTLSSEETGTNTLDVQSLSANQPESYALGSPAFLRRYGKTYSRRSNLTPLTQSLKTYGARNNPKPKDVNSSFLSNSERFTVGQDSSVDSVENAVKIQAPKKTGVRNYSLQNIPSKSESSNPKVLIKDTSRVLANELTKHEVIKLATQKLDQSSDKMTKKMVLLNNRSGGSQMVTLYVMQNNQPVSTVHSDNRVIIPSEKESSKCHPAPSSTSGNRVSLANQIFPTSHLNLIVSESAGKNKNTLVPVSARENNASLKKPDSDELGHQPQKYVSNPQVDFSVNSNVPTPIKSKAVQRDLIASHVHVHSSHLQNNLLDIAKPANNSLNMNETHDKIVSLKKTTLMNKPIVHVSLQKDNTLVKNDPSKVSISGQLVRQPQKGFLKSNKDFGVKDVSLASNDSKEVQGCVKSLQKDFPESTKDSLKSEKAQQKFSSSKDQTLLNENVPVFVEKDDIEATVDIPESQNNIVNKRRATEETGYSKDQSVDHKNVLAIPVGKEDAQPMTNLSKILISDQLVQQSQKSILKSKAILLTSPQRGGRIDHEGAADMNNPLKYQPVSINFIPTSGKLMTSVGKSISTSLKEIPKDSSLQNRNNHPISADKDISLINNNALEESGSVKLDDMLQKCASDPQKDLNASNTVSASITAIGSHCSSENDTLDISKSGDNSLIKEKKEKLDSLKDSTLLNRNVMPISVDKDDAGMQTSPAKILTSDKLAEWPQKGLSKACEDLDPNVITLASEDSKGMQTGVKVSQNSDQSQNDFFNPADNSLNKEANQKPASFKDLSVMNRVNFCVSVGRDDNMAETEPSKMMASDSLVQQSPKKELDAILLNSNSSKEIQTGVNSLQNQSPKSTNNSDREKICEKSGSFKDPTLPNKYTYPISIGNNVSQRNNAVDISNSAKEPLTKEMPSLENFKAVKKVEGKKKKNLISPLKNTSSASLKSGSMFFEELDKTKSNRPKEVNSIETGSLKLRTPASSQEPSISSNSGSIFKENDSCLKPGQLSMSETMKTSGNVAKDVIKKKMKQKVTTDSKKSTTTDYTSLAGLTFSSSYAGKDNKTGVKEKEMSGQKKIVKKDKCYDSPKKSRVSKGDSKMKIFKKKAKSSDQTVRAIAEIADKSQVLALPNLEKYVPVLSKVEHLGRETFKEVPVSEDARKVKSLLTVHQTAASASKMDTSLVIDSVSLSRGTECESLLLTSPISIKQKPSIARLESTNDKIPTSVMKKKKKKKRLKSSILVAEKEDQKAAVLSDLSTELKKKKPKMSKLSKGTEVERLNLSNDADMNRSKMSNDSRNNKQQSVLSKENSIKKPKMLKLTSDIDIKKSKSSNKSHIQIPELLTDMSVDKLKKSKVKKRKSNMLELSTDSSMKKPKKLKLKKSKILKVSLDEEMQHSKLPVDTKTEKYKPSMDAALKKPKSATKGEKTKLENSILSSVPITIEPKLISTTSPTTSTTSTHSSSPKSVFNSEYMSSSSNTSSNTPDISKNDDDMLPANEALPSPLRQHTDLSSDNKPSPRYSPLGLTCAKDQGENKDSTILADTPLPPSYLDDLSKLTCKRLTASINNRSYSPSSLELNIETKLKELLETSYEQPTPLVSNESNDSFTRENQNQNNCQENRELPCSRNANQSFTPHQKTQKRQLQTPPSKKSFQCSFCGKKFRNRGHLIGHTQVHSSKKCCYKCNICQKRFPTKRNLHEHQRFTAKRPNQCLDCDRDEERGVGYKTGTSGKADDPTTFETENMEEDKILNSDLENNESNSSCLTSDKFYHFSLDDLKPAASPNLETEDNDIKSSRLSSDISYEKDLESARSRLIARRDRRENRIRMLQRHLAGETASDVVQDLNCDEKLTKSKPNSKSESRSSTPERKSGTQGCASDVKSPLILPTIKTSSCKMISENSSSMSEGDMGLKINHSFSLDLKEFHEFGSVGNMQEILNLKGLESSSMKIDPGIEFPTSELPPPLLSPQNLSPVACVMLGEENSTFQLKTEEPPFLSKMVSLDLSTGPDREIFPNDPTLETSASNKESSAGDPVKEKVSGVPTDFYGESNSQKVSLVDQNRKDETKDGQSQEVYSSAKTESTRIKNERNALETGSSEFANKQVSNVGSLLGEDKGSVCAPENSKVSTKSDVPNPTSKESEILGKNVISADQTIKNSSESEESSDVMSNSAKKKGKVVFMPMSAKNTSISPQWINLGDWTKFVLHGSQKEPSGDVDPNKRSEAGSGQSEKMYLSVRTSSSDKGSEETKSSKSEEKQNVCVREKCSCCFCREINVLPSTCSTSDNDSKNHCPYSESTSTEFSGRCKLGIGDPLKGKRDISLSVSETPEQTTGHSESTNEAGGLAKSVIPEDQNAKKREGSEECDRVIPDTAHKLEGRFSVSDNSLPSPSINLGEWTKMIVQSSIKKLSADAELGKRSEEKPERPPGIFLSTKAESSKRVSKTVSKERRSSGSTSKRKLSAENENSCDLCAEGDGSSSTCSHTAPKPEKKPCLDTEQGKPLNSSPTCSDVAPKIEKKECPDTKEEDDPLQPKDLSPESVNVATKDKDGGDNGATCNESPKSNEKYGMSKRNLSRLPSEPVRHLPKRNYKKPQKYFCSDFDYSINFNLLKRLQSTTIPIKNSSSNNASPSKSRAGSSESPEKKNSQQAHKNNGNCSPSKKVTSATNNKNNNNKNNNDSKDNNSPKDILNLKPESKTGNETSSPNKTSSSPAPPERTKRKYDMRKRNLQKEMKEKAKMLSREELSKGFLRLRFNAAEGATENEDDYNLQQQYHKKKLLKNATVKKHTVVPKTAKIRKGMQILPKQPNESHLNPVKLLPANPKPPLSVVTTERKILPAPTPESLANREKLLKNLIDYGSVNFTVTDEKGKCSIKKDSEDVRTEPTQLSKLLSNPLTGTPSLSLPHSMLPLPVITSSAPSGTQITTLIPMAGMQTVNSMPLPISVGSNMLPIVNSGPLFVSSLPAPLPENMVQEQKPVLLHILPLADSNANLEQENKDVKENLCAFQIKKEVTYDDADYGKQPSDGLSGLCITGVRGGVTTHDMIPTDSDALSSNPMFGSSCKIKEESPLDWSVTRRRPLKCTLVQVEDGLGHSKFVFECCGLSFLKLPELASHLDSCHK